MEKRTGRVVKVLNPFEVVVNVGSLIGVEEADGFVVYAEGDELKDPDTEESLGTLEIVRGRARATHVQEKLTTLRSTETESKPEQQRRPILRSPIERLAGLRPFEPQEEYVTEYVEAPAPFRNVAVGDLARRL